MKKIVTIEYSGLLLDNSPAENVIENLQQAVIKFGAGNVIIQKQYDKWIEQPYYAIMINREETDVEEDLRKELDHSNKRL